MTARETIALLDSVATLRIDQPGGTLHVHVRVLDLREVFGRTDALVTPVSGSTPGGQGAWVCMDRITPGQA